MKTATAGILLLVLCCCGCGPGGSEGPQYALLVDADGAPLLEVTIKIADTEETRREGLRLHPPLAQDEALLLVFPAETNVCITNAGVPYAIDILYLSESRQVIATEQAIPADSPGPYCHAPTAMVMELRGDTLRGINPAAMLLY